MGESQSYKIMKGRSKNSIPKMPAYDVKNTYCLGCLKKGTHFKTFAFIPNL